MTRARVRPLVLPHPQLELRPFVLRPLLDIAPRLAPSGVETERPTSCGASVAKRGAGQCAETPL